MSTPQQRNTDRLQTVLGACEAGAIAVADTLIHLGPEGLDYQATTFWIGIGLAFLRAFKSYYAAGVVVPNSTPSQPESKDPV